MPAIHILYDPKGRLSPPALASLSQIGVSVVIVHIADADLSLADVERITADATRMLLEQIATRAPEGA